MSFREEEWGGGGLRNQSGKTDYADEESKRTEHACHEVLILVRKLVNNQPFRSVSIIYRDAFDMFLVYVGNFHDYGFPQQLITRFEN